MFCPSCGSPVEDDARFCTSCGADLAVPSPAPPSLESIPPAPSPAPPASAQGGGAPRQGGVRWQIVAIALSLVVIIVSGAGIAMRLLGGEDGSSSPTCVFGARESVSVSRVTRIVPAASEANPLQNYVVCVRAAAGRDGRAIDVSGIPRLDVEGETGFSMADFGEIAEGIYEVTVTPDDGAPQFIPPVSVVDGKPGDEAGEEASGGDSDAVELPEEIIVVPPDHSEGSGHDLSVPMRLGRYGAYLDKVRELQLVHGEVSVVTTSDGGDVWLSGLCYVGLVDFGDGAERLVVAYGDSELVSRHPYLDESYAVEVWGYDVESDEAVLEWSGKPSYTNGGYAHLSFWYPVDGTGPYLVQESPDSSFVVTGVSEDGAFGVAYELAQTFSDPTDALPLVNTVNGEAVEGAAFSRIMTELGFDAATRVFLMTSPFDGSMGDPSDVAGITQETVALLESLAGDIVDAALREDGDRTGEAEEPVNPATLTYAGEEVTEVVSVPAYNNADLAPMDPIERTWGYLVFSASGEGSAVDRVNARLKGDFDEELAATLAWTYGSAEPECLRQRSSLDYLAGSVAGFRIYRNVTLWGAHGNSETEGYVIDLATGEEMEPWGALGVDRSELDEAAAGLLRDYVLSTEGALYDEGTIGNTPEEFLAGDHYMLTEDGITLYLGDYDFFAYAAGHHEILVWPTGKKAAGTDVTAAYAFPYE